MNVNTRSPLALLGLLLWALHGPVLAAAAPETPATEAGAETTGAPGEAPAKADGKAPAAAALQPGPGGNQVDPSPVAPVAEIGETEQALRDRVLARWDALLKRDYDAVYGFTTPSYRKVFTKQDYLGRFAEQVRRDKVEIHHVEFLNEARTKARVRVIIHFTTTIPGGLYQGTNGIWETWVVEAGQWWIVGDK